MTATERIIGRFQKRGIRKGSELLLSFPESLGFIEACRAEGLVILGIDFWTRRDDSLVELGGWSADFSPMAKRPDAVAATAKAAEDEIQRWMPDGREYIRSRLIATPPDVLPDYSSLETAEWASFVVTEY